MPVRFELEMAGTRPFELDLYIYNVYINIYEKIYTYIPGLGIGEKQDQ